MIKCNKFPLSKEDIENAKCDEKIKIIIYIINLQMNFTVIVPVYNEIKNIEHVLNSLYTQTRKPDEIIVVDG